MNESLRRPSILKPLLAILLLVAVFGAGVLTGEARDKPVCPICEKPLPVLSQNGVHADCLQARIAQYATEMNPEAGMAGMESDGRPGSDQW